MTGVSEIDIQQRGAFGIQADYGIRGSTFQQTAILLDGVKINDSQTAHFNCDIPLPLVLLEQINIVPGQGSSIYGSAAMCGTLDIKSKNAESNSFFLKSYAASYNTFYSGGTLSLSSPHSYLLLSADESSSDGYSYDLDFRRFAAAIKTGCEEPGFTTDFYAGYSGKDFGAYDFYTPGKNMPSREKTEALLLSSSSKIFFQKDTANITLSYKRHLDDFILTLLNPSAYKNIHMSNDARVELSYNPFFDNGIKSIFGLSYGVSALDSSNLGKRQEEAPGVFIETFLPVTESSSLAGAVLFEARKQLCETAASLAFAFKPDPGTDIRLSAGRAFRFPSFTELYYIDPFNIGSEKLAAEKAYSLELALASVLSPESKGSLTLFYRYQNEMIDWVSESGLWKAQNTGTADFYGASTNLEYSGNKILRAGLSYSFIKAVPGTAYVSKYALNFPEHKLTVNLSLNLPWEITLSLPALFIVRNNTGNYETFSLTVLKKTGDLSLTFSINNLFDRQYQDVAGVPAPGRIFSMGAEIYFR